MPEKHVEVLLMDDDPGDILLMQESLKKSKLLINMATVENGEEGMNYLRKVGQFTKAPTPDLILLDLNMPIKDGREVLREIKKDDQLKKIPVVILTTSDSDRDVASSYSNGANCYIKKPVDFEQFQKMVGQISDFWFSLVKLPSL